jgi:hypothetical protein
MFGVLCACGDRNEDLDRLADELFWEVAEQVCDRSARKDDSAVDIYDHDRIRGRGEDGTEKVA